MTRQQIEQYGKLQREISMLEDQILDAETSGEYVTDVVRGSTKTAPYAVHNIVIKGYGSRNLPKLLDRKAKRVAECEAIEQYIDDLNDSLIRQLLTWRYVEGRDMKETAKMVGYSEKQASRILANFFEKMSADVR